MTSRSPKRFPVRNAPASGATEPRPIRGAHNKRLPGSEAAPSAITAPIAGRNSEVHEASTPARDGEGAPRIAPRGQLPGCLPAGYDLDSLLTVEQFAAWRQKSEREVRSELPKTKGMIKRNRKDIRIHPRTYLELSIKVR